MGDMEKDTTNEKSFGKKLGAVAGGLGQ